VILWIRSRTDAASLGIRMSDLTPSRPPYAMTGGRRDLVSVGGVRASRYEVMVDEDVADEAARILSQRSA
jgi:hypothetical protein